MTFPAPTPEEEPSRLDSVLVERVRAGDSRAFEELFTTHYGALCGFVDSYVHSEAVAEELVADLFRRIWEQRERWAPTTSIANYLFGAARNRALDYLKHQRIEERARRTITPATKPLGMGSAPPSTDAAVTAAELDAAIQRAIDALPERRRLAFTLRRQHGMSYADIAAVMGTAVKTVEIQIGLALKSLRESLADWVE